MTAMLDGVAMDQTEHHPDETSHAAGEVLHERVVDSLRARDEALLELREMMSDEEILSEFGIDVDRLT